MTGEQLESASYDKPSTDKTCKCCGCIFDVDQASYPDIGLCDDCGALVEKMAEKLEKIFGVKIEIKEKVEE